MIGDLGNNTFRYVRCALAISQTNELELWYDRCLHWIRAYGCSKRIVEMTGDVIGVCVRCVDPQQIKIGKNMCGPRFFADLQNGEECVTSLVLQMKAYGVGAQGSKVSDLLRNCTSDVGAMRAC